MNKTCDHRFGGFVTSSRQPCSTADTALLDRRRSLSPVVDPKQLRTPFICLGTTAALATAALMAPARAEIVQARCTLAKYDTNTIESFDCNFRQSGGNVQVWSSRWNFEFSASKQGVDFVRINADPLAFHRLGQYSLWVQQGD